MANKNLKLPALSTKGGYDLGRKWLYLLVCIIIIAFLFFILRANFLSQEAKKIECNEEVNKMILMNNLIACMSYADEREYFGIIDLDKFTNENLNLCLGYAGREMAVSLGDKTIKTAEELPGSTVEYEKRVAVYNRERGEFESKAIKLQMEKKC